MYKDNKIIIGMNDAGEYSCLLPQMANRHGLVTGATGTGKTVTIKVMAEAFSDMGVPVFMADVKGDVAGLYNPGTDSDDMQERIARFNIGDTFSYHGYPVAIWDIFGQNGIPLRTTISEMGPLLLSRILNLNETQSGILSIAFKIAEDSEIDGSKLLLIDTKDLKSLLNYMSENRKALMADYGNITPQSVAAIIRSIVALESAGGDQFFGEKALDIRDWIQLDAATGRGVINILDSSSLVNDGRLYSTFLIWFLSEIYEQMPEVGDLEKPKMVFFFDEAHLLFNDAPKALLEKIEQVIKLIRSKGIGIYFCTQNPRDIPDAVLAQLGNKVQHALHAYTPAEQKAVRAAADSYRVNENFDTYETILALGTGEAVVSFLDEDGTPGICEKVAVLPPQSSFDAIDAVTRDRIIKNSFYYTKYIATEDPDSAYEMLMRIGERAAAAKLAEEQNAIERIEQEKAAREAEKQAEKEAKEAEKAAAKLAKEEAKKKKQMSNAVGGTVGRQVGQSIGSALLGSFGKKLGGNIGAQLGRNLLGTFIGLNDDNK